MIIIAKNKHASNPRYLSKEKEFFFVNLRASRFSAVFTETLAYKECVDAKSVLCSWSINKLHLLRFGQRANYQKIK